jgi:hypothetical protein
MSLNGCVGGIHCLCSGEALESLSANLGMPSSDLRPVMQALEAVDLHLSALDSLASSPLGGTGALPLTDISNDSNAKPCSTKASEHES